MQRSNMWAIPEKFHCLELHLYRNISYKNSLSCGEIDPEYGHGALSGLMFCFSCFDLSLCQVDLTKLVDSLLASLRLKLIAAKLHRAAWHRNI